MACNRYARTKSQIKLKLTFVCLIWFLNRYCNVNSFQWIWYKHQVNIFSHINGVYYVIVYDYVTNETYTFFAAAIATADFIECSRKKSNFIWFALQLRSVVFWKYINSFSYIIYITFRETSATQLKYWLHTWFFRHICTCGNLCLEIKCDLTL